MTDAQPADQLVAALEAIIEERECECFGQHWPECSAARAAKALPIAREMAEREREKDAYVTAAFAALEQWSRTWNALLGWVCEADVPDELRAEIVQSLDARLVIHAALDRARAAGVEVTGHE